MNTFSDDGDFLSKDATSSLKDWISELFQSENLRHSWPWTIFLILIYSIIFLVGLAGNFLVILVYCRRRQMRSVTNLFIVNLAVADIFVILFCVPVTLISNIFVPWILGTFMCKGVAYVQGISVFASAYSLAAISAERCKGIYHFKPVTNHISKLQALFIIVFIWITAFVILVPWPIVFELTPIPENSTTLFCVESWTDEFTGNMYFLFGNLMSCYAIPGFLICLTNSQVCWRVSNRKVPIGSASPKSVTKYHRKVKSGVKKMLSLVTFTFLLSWLPLYVVMCRVKFTSIESMSDTELDILDILIPLVQLLGTSNSCVNPIFYTYMNSRFREMCKSVFYISTDCSLSCYARNSRRTNSHRSLLVVRGRLTNGNFCSLRIRNVNHRSQQSNSTSSCSISPRSCQEDRQFFGASCNRKCCPSYQAHISPYICARQEIRILKLSRETSV